METDLFLLLTNDKGAFRANGKLELFRELLNSLNFYQPMPILPVPKQMETEEIHRQEVSDAT